MLSLVFGTRPEAIKMGPVAAELRALGATFGVVATGQHRELLAGTPAEGDLAGGTHLDMASDGNVTRWLERAQRKLRALFKETKPKLVVVQGDTMSSLSGMRAAVQLEIPVAHIEAGVRSHNLSDPWPEEPTRVEIDRFATWFYAPTKTARDNLLAENLPSERIVITGNTVVSALRRYASQVVPVATPDPLALVTFHRREVRIAKRAVRICHAINEVARTWPGWCIVWPVHPSFVKILEPNSPEMLPNVVINQHTTYAPFVETLARAAVVITDSGGVVEEAATLGVPTVIVRNTNDRPEAVKGGIALMCQEPESISVAVRRALMLPRQPSAVFGDSSAASRVARHLIEMASKA